MDIDVSKQLPDRIHETLKTMDNTNDISFFVTVSYENLPRYCSSCRVIGHDDYKCMKLPGQAIRNINMGGKLVGEEKR